MTSAKDSRYNPDMWLFRKSFDFRSANSVEDCAEKIRSLNGGKLGTFRVGVRIINANDEINPIQFIIITKYGRITGGLKGELRDEQGTAILTGFAGITADILFLFSLAILGAPMMFLMVYESEREFIRLVYACLFCSPAIVIMYTGCITTRNALIRRIMDLLL